MAKTIKFNLVLDGYPVRKLEDLQEHFSIEDLLKYFYNGLLERWLTVREYDEQLEAVRKIASECDRKSIVKNLINIFDMPIANDDADKAVAILDYLDKANQCNAECKENAFNKKQMIENYHAGYHALILHMEENRDNMVILKADTIVLEREYLGLFALDSYPLYFRLLRNAPKAVYSILSKDAFRKYWFDKGCNKKIYESIVAQLLPVDNIKRILGEDLKIIRRNTQAMWDQIERSEVELMVLNMANGTFIKNAGKFSEKLGSDVINFKLVRLHGLEYQCNNEKLELLYIEV